MKKLLYSMPALLLLGLVAAGIFVAGFDGLAPIVWAYLLCAVAGSGLLLTGRWWGAFAGCGAGLVMLLNQSATAVLNEGTVGMCFILVYLLLGGMCRKERK